MFSAMFKKSKSTDFPLECRAMYYFAKGRHAHQERKGSGMPYFVHPRGVAWLVKRYGGTTVQINAAAIRRNRRASAAVKNTALSVTML